MIFSQIILFLVIKTKVKPKNYKSVTETKITFKLKNNWKKLNIKRKSMEN